MKAPYLTTSNPSIRLIAPNVVRDAALSVAWLNSESGCATMLLMGNSAETVDAMLPTNLARETERVKDFLKRTDQLNWMIAYKGTVVGSVWVEVQLPTNCPLHQFIL